MRHPSSRAIIVSSAIALFAITASAQTPVTWDNVHINVTEPAKAADWYAKTFGATPIGAPGQAVQAKIGSVILVFLKGQEPQTSAGSAIDHIGLSFENLDAALKQAESAGAKILNPVRDVPGLFKLAFIEDPFGIKVEMVQDPELLGFHHLHLSVAKPDVTLQWYQDMFGGERTKLKGRIDGLRYGGVWLLAQSNNGKISNPNGSIQYPGLGVTNLHERAAALQAKSVKFRTQPTQLRNLWYTIVEDCDGSRVEMIQRSAQ